MTEPDATPEEQRRRVLVQAAAMTWVVVLVVGQLLLGERLVVVPWLALAALGASLQLPWRETTWTAAAGVVAVALLSAELGDLGTVPGVVRVLGSTALAAFAVLGAAVRVRREERVRRVAEVAAVAQAAILHPVPTQAGGLGLASRYVSATTDALVGGDLFDVVVLGGGARLIVGDARGKGLSALHTSAAVLSAFRHLAPQAALGLDDLARGIERALLPGLGDEDFVTAVLCELHPCGRVDLVRCGHPPPLLLAPGRPPAEVGVLSCPPLGLGVDPQVETGALLPGERLLLYTDGLVEARDRTGAFFDLASAADGLVARGPTSAAALDGDLERLLDRVRAHVGGTLTDDVAVLLVEWRSPAAAPVTPVVAPAG